MVSQTHVSETSYGYFWLSGTRIRCCASGNIWVPSSNLGLFSFPDLLHNLRLTHAYADGTEVLTHGLL